MPGEKKFRILVAEDNEINLMVISGLLEHAGYAFGVVRNGEEVLKALGSEPYDLVVMDCLMPIMDGFEATRAIRASRSGAFDPDIPVLAITALAAPGDRERCIQCGMTDYVSKPIVASELYDQLSKLLGHGRKAPPLVDRSTDAVVPAAFEPLRDRLIADILAWQAQLEALLRESSSVELGRLAHKIRGSADVFRLESLSQAAAGLETAVRAGRDHAVPTLTRSLHGELGDAASQLSRDTQAGFVPSEAARSGSSRLS